MRNLQSNTRLDDDRLIVELCVTLDVQVGVDTHAHPEGKSSACYASSSLQNLSREATPAAIDLKTSSLRLSPVRR